MTEVSFHFNVAERTAYTCRLLRKAVRQGATVVVTAPRQLLDAFDQALWSFEPTEFVPHVTLRADAPLPERLRPTPVWLTDDPRSAPRHDVLVNLHPGDGGVPVGFASYTRLIEIVSDDAGERLAARERWKHYTTRGYAVAPHDAGGEARLG